MKDGVERQKKNVNRCKAQAVKKTINKNGENHLKFTSEFLNYAILPARKKYLVGSLISINNVPHIFLLSLMFLLISKKKKNVY